jgi:hypothetical protein
MAYLSGVSICLFFFTIYKSYQYFLIFKRQQFNISQVEILCPIIGTTSYFLGEAKVDFLNTQIGIGIYTLIVGPPSIKRSRFLNTLTDYLAHIDASVRTTNQNNYRVLTNFDYDDFCFPFTELSTRKLMSKHVNLEKIFLY